MRNTVVAITLFILVSIFIINISFTQESSELFTQESSEPFTQEIFTQEPFKQKIFKGRIFVNPDKETRLKVDRASLREEGLTRLGKYEKTLIYIDEDTKIDWYILKAPDSHGDMIFSEKTGYPSNISQIVLDKKGKKNIVWSDLGVLFSKDGKEDFIPNMNIVPIYDVIYNEKLNQIQILYSSSLYLSSSTVDLESKKRKGYIAVYTTLWIPFVHNTGEMKSAQFITPDIVRVTNTVDGIFHIKLLNDFPKNRTRNVDLLYWNGKGSDFAIDGYDKSETYYVGGDEPTYDENVLDDWYKMNKDNSEKTE